MTKLEVSPEEEKKVASSDQWDENSEREVNRYDSYQDRQNT